MRIIPISLPDGRIIENTGDETQEIRMEFTKMNITKLEDDNVEGAKDEVKQGRVIPIKLATGDTVMPSFTQLEVVYKIYAPFLIIINYYYIVTFPGNTVV